jgi:hypothetical protein
MNRAGTTIIGIIIGALIAGGGVYLTQKNAIDAEREQLREQITGLEQQVNQLEQPLTTAEQSPQQTVINNAYRVLEALKNNDSGKLADLAHPEKGIRFSPYAYVDLKKDLVFKPEGIRNGFSDQTKYTWGNYDGIGDPIELTFQEYLKKFVYDQDFSKAKEIGINHSIGTGNTINNASQAYPEANIVEYHFPGLDPRYEGMDWRSLRLVFENTNNNWYLTGIIHDQWTI